MTICFPVRGRPHVRGPILARAYSRSVTARIPGRPDRALANGRSRLGRARPVPGVRSGRRPERVDEQLVVSAPLTLRTLVSLATALDGRFEVQFRPYKPSGDSYAGHGADAGDA